MAASSAKDKANSLKDSYVAGLIEGGATAPAPSMPTQDMGEQASLVVDLSEGDMRWKNDGDPHMYTQRNGLTVKSRDENLRYPLDNKPMGASSVHQLTRGQHEVSTKHYEGSLNLENMSRQTGYRAPGQSEVFYNRR